jgi:hypothetical protein
MRRFASVIVLLLVAGVARAEPTAAELATARKTFEEGIALEAAGDWAGALAAFRRVAAVKTNHIVRFHVALGLEKTGRLVEALGEFALARVQAEREGGTDADLTIANAKKHVDAIRARLPSVRIEQPAIDGVALTIDDRPVETNLLGAAIPLDPGAHVIVVRAPGHRAFTARVELVEGRTEPVVIGPALEPIATARPRREVPERSDAPSRTWTWISGGVGAASLIGAGVAYGVRQSALSDLTEVCEGDRTACDPARRDLDDRGRRATAVGNVLLGVAAIATTTAIVLLLVEPSKDVRGGVVVSGNGVAFHARF